MLEKRLGECTRWVILDGMGYGLIHKNPQYAGVSKAKSTVSMAEFVSHFAPCLKKWGSLCRKTAAVVLGDGPAAYYRLDEASGTAAHDSSGNGNVGTYSTAGVSYGISGAISNDSDPAASFNGSSGQVTIPNAAALAYGQKIQPKEMSGEQRPNCND